MTRLCWLVALLLGLCLSAAAQEPTPSPTPIFSGQTELYQDTVNGFKLAVPIEFKVASKGLTTDWTGPMIEGSGSTLWVNATPMAGIHPQALYEGSIRSKKSDPGITDVQVVKFKQKLLGKPVYGFWCKEVTVKPGTRDPKAGDEPHRWHLYVFGNDRQYQCSAAAGYFAFDKKLVQATFEKLLKSFQPIPIK